MRRDKTPPDAAGNLEAEERAILEQRRRTDPFGSVEGDPEDWPDSVNNWYFEPSDDDPAEGRPSRAAWTSAAADVACQNEPITGERRRVGGAR